MALITDTLARIESGEINHRRVGEVGLFEGYPDGNLGFSGINGHVNTVKVRGQLIKFIEDPDYGCWIVQPEGAPDGYYTHVYF